MSADTLCAPVEIPALYGVFAWRSEPETGPVVSPRFTLCIYCIYWTAFL